MILLGVAPCTAMVFVWSRLTHGHPLFTLSQVALNDAIMMVAFAPLVAFLLGLSAIIVPWDTLITSVVLYIVFPVIIAQWLRRSLLARGQDAFDRAMHRIQPWSSVTAKFEVGYADRAADTYEWAQDYYALLDTELINATPDSQRYINHPQLYQYYLANREQWKTKADFTWLPTDKWNLGLDLEWRNDDYDKSQLGLTRSEWYRSYATATFVPSATLSASIYAGYDNIKNDQGSRAFNGGPEKNAFEIYPPLPQASDPAQNWSIDGEDTSITVGTSLEWQVASDLRMSLGYQYVDTQGQQNFNTNDTGTVVAGDLPDVNTRLHQVEASGTWDVRDNLSLKLDYQFYSYKTDDWAWDNVQPNTIGKVLTFGQGNPNDDINYIGASVIYRWQ